MDRALRIAKHFSKPVSKFCATLSHFSPKIFGILIICKKVAWKLGSLLQTILLNSHFYVFYIFQVAHTKKVNQDLEFDLIISIYRTSQIVLFFLIWRFYEDLEPFSISFVRKYRLIPMRANYVHFWYLSHNVTWDCLLIPVFCTCCEL